MKTKVIITILIMIVITNNIKAGLVTTLVEDKDFYSSGQILPGEQWYDVGIYNDGTIVDMLGGEILHSVGTFNSSVLNVTGGNIGDMYAFNYSKMNLSGGSVYSIYSHDNSIINFSSGMEVNVFHADNFSIGNITGGIVDFLGIGDSATINLFGGHITQSLGASGLSVVNIFGYGLIYNPNGGALDGGRINGYWLNGDSFVIDLYGVDTYSHITIIPEPNTIILLALGSFFLRRKY